MSAISTSVTIQRPTFLGALLFTGLGLRVLCAAAMYGLTYVEPLALPALAAVLAGDLFIFVWQLMRFGNVAADHLRQTGHFWTVVSGFTFFGLMGIVMVVQWWLLYQGVDMAARTVKEPVSSYTQSSKSSFDDRFKVSMTRDGKTMFFSGVMSDGMARKLEPMLDRSQALQTVTLDSPGGNLYEARSFARRIQKRGLNTHVAKECSASCTLVFVAGTQRTLGPGAELGFHRYGLDFEQLLPNVQTTKEIPEDRKYLVGRGIDVRFLERVFTIDRGPIWYPTRTQLETAGVVTRP